MNLRANKALKYLLISCIFLVFFSCAKRPNHEARIVFVAGKADIIHKDGGIEPAALKKIITMGDTIKTGSGYVLVQIGDDIMVRIQPDTNTEMARLFEGNETSLFLENGQLISHVRKLSKENNFRIQTPTAVASVRGTQYSVSYYKSRSVLAVKEGRVELNTSVKDIKKEYMVNAGNTLVINTGKSRNINEFESLEIEKISDIPYNTTEALNNDETYKLISQRSGEADRNCDDKIKADGGPIPKTFEDMLKAYGFVNKVTLYNNKQYTGIITSRGAVIKIMTLDGFESVPFRQIRNIKRVRE